MTVDTAERPEPVAAPPDEQVVVLARFGRDAGVVNATLRVADVFVRVARDMADLAECVRVGTGALLLTSESLTRADAAELNFALAEQPTWSDLPVLLLLASEDELGPATARHLTTLRSAHNVIALQRPIPPITLVTAVQSALRARRRQYEVRDLLARERRAREEAETATRIKDEFLASVSHELRTPLSAILIWAHLLDDNRLSAEQVRHARHAITSGAESQSQLIEDLLDVSRMLTGRMRLVVREQPLVPILNAALEVVRPMADAKGVLLDLRLSSSADVVRVDADRAQQIFWNLLSNAVKFTPAFGRVSIELAREQQQVRVQVTDTGEGIEPEFLPYVFERFRQADASSTRRQGGLGLGLTITHQLVELHGGTVDVASAGKGKGATFTVRLPLAMVEPTTVPSPPTAESLSVDSLGGVRVLLVEEAPDMQLAISWLLQQLGAEVTVVGTPAAAVSTLTSMARERYPHVLISDVEMHERDGNALLRTLRAQEHRTGARALPAIAVSARAREEDRLLALQAGFQVHLAKPVSPRALEAAIQEVLQPRSPGGTAKESTQST